MVRLTAKAMSNEATTRTYNGILHCIGRVLRDRNESVVKGPIPRRWVQLIKQLNEKEHRARLPRTEQGCLVERQRMSGRTPRREAKYRGYEIKMERRDLCWVVTLSPASPELPILNHCSFRTITQSERVAMAQARRRVDQALRE
jgi:hypothetical protein